MDGTLVVLAAMQENVSIATLPMILNRITLKGWPSGAPADTEETVKFGVQAGVAIPVEKFSLEDAQKAYDKMEDGSVRFRSVIVMGK